MKTINKIISTLVRLHRESMRDCALEYRRCVARRARPDADVWLTFAIYHREATRSTESELLTDQTSIPPDLVKKVDAIVRRMAEEF